MVAAKLQWRHSREGVYPVMSRQSVGVESLAEMTYDLTRRISFEPSEVPAACMQITASVKET